PGRSRPAQPRAVLRPALRAEASRATCVHLPREGMRFEGPISCARPMDRPLAVALEGERGWGTRHDHRALEVEIAQAKTAAVDAAVAASPRCLYASRGARCE